MARSSMENFDIPPEVRTYAEKSVQQARQAFEGFMSAAHRTVSSIEDRAELARRNANDVGQKAMTFAEQNIASSFDLAHRLVRAKDADEMLNLQVDYIKSQMQRLAEQAKTLGEQTGAMAKGPGRQRH